MSKRRAKGANEARSAEGVSREKNRDAQGVKLRHLADIARNGAADIQVGQLSAIVVCEEAETWEYSVGGVRSALICSNAGIHERMRAAARRRGSAKMKWAARKTARSTHSALPCAPGPQCGLKHPTRAPALLTQSCH